MQTIPLRPAAIVRFPFHPRAPQPDRPIGPGLACAACSLQARCVAGLARDHGSAAGQLVIGRRRVRKGEPLFREGDPFASLYAVRCGTFKSAFALDDGCEEVTAFFFGGDMVGFEGIARGRHATTATALEDSEVCALPYEELMQARSAGGVAAAMRLAQLTAAELVREQAAKAIASLRHADPRVAAFLLWLSGRMAERGYSGTSLQLRMSRAEIGSYLGLSMESVSRAFSALAADGSIEVRQRSVELLSVDSLRALAGPARAVVDRRGGVPAARAAGSLHAA